jgi:hypothetical protein
MKTIACLAAASLLTVIFVGASAHALADAVNNDRHPIDVLALVSIVNVLWLALMVWIGSRLHRRHRQAGR